MSCRLDESAQSILAVSSREDKMKIINIENNEILHEVRDIGGDVYAMETTDNANKIAFGTKKGEINVLSWV